MEDDQLAQAFITKPDLLTHLCDPEVLKKMAETHPCLMEAANNLAAAVHEEQQSSGKSGSSTSESGAAVSGGSYYLDELSDEEMDTDDGEQPRHGRRSTGAAAAGITPSQLAQALAMASGIGQGAANFNPFAGVTGDQINVRPTHRHLLSSKRILLINKTSRAWCWKQSTAGPGTRW